MRQKRSVNLLDPYSLRARGETKRAITTAETMTRVATIIEAKKIPTSSAVVTLYASQVSEWE